MLIGHQSEVIYCGETGRQSYNNFAQPRFIDKQRPNQEFDDSGFGQGQDDLNRSNGYTTAQHTHFGEDSQDTISQPVYHPSRPTYHAPHLVQQSYHVDNQSNRTEFNFSYPHQPLHSRPQQQQHQQRFHQNQKNNNSYQDPNQIARNQQQGFSVQNPYVNYQNQVNPVAATRPTSRKKTYTDNGIEDPEGIQAALAWNNAYSSDLLYTYIVEQERQFHLNHKPLCEMQTEISVNDRTTLMTWLIRICISNHFQSMHLEALHLCVAIIDDYLSRVVVDKDKFQLIGVTALLLASKQLIYDPPDISSLVLLCELIYTAEDIKTCEEQMLKILDWTLHRPTGHTFVDFFAGRLLYQKPFQHEKRIIRHLAVARYCLTIGLLSSEFTCLFPSVRARAAYICAAQILQEPHLDLPFGEEDIMLNATWGSRNIRHGRQVNNGVDILKKVMSDQTEQGLAFQPRTIDLYSYP